MKLHESWFSLVDEPVPDEKDQKRSGGSDNGELTEGEQESLPNDQTLPPPPPPIDNDLHNDDDIDDDEPPPHPSTSIATPATSHKKNGWRASRTKETSPESNDSSDFATAIPRIQISVEEPNDGDKHLSSVSSDPTHLRRASKSGDEDHSQWFFFITNL